MARPGNVGFLSQSGALCTAILDWSLRVNVGFSAFVSIGSMLDVGWGDLIDYLADDPETKCIVIYMETIGDARAFLSAAREVALTKPIIVIKAGRTEAAAKAAASHTGLARRQRRGARRRVPPRAACCGSNTISRGLRHGRGAGQAAAAARAPAGDRHQRRRAGRAGHRRPDRATAASSPSSRRATTAALDAFLPPHWSQGNPIDILGDADAARYARALEVAAQDPGIDGLLVILTPQAMTDPTATAEQLAPFAHVAGKPVLASWMGGEVGPTRRGDPRPRRHPHLPLPRHRRPRLHAMWRSH